MGTAVLFGWFARQRWRAWIETPCPAAWAGACTGSPVSDGGRGLKQQRGGRALQSRLGSPVSDGGRGLKRITTRAIAVRHFGSPVSDGGRGLKPGQLKVSGYGMPRFARQRWRAWIETARGAVNLYTKRGFARQRWRAWIETGCSPHATARCAGSPVSDGGRGLKHPPIAPAQRQRPVRPSAMAGVD